jgi:rod shape-determining protein MreC
VGPTTATVQLANDSAFTAGCRMSTARLAVGAVSGNGRGKPMGLTLLDNTVRLEVGQMLVTFPSGPGGPFVPEVPIGKVTRVTPANGQIAQTAAVAPFVDFGSLDIVAVVTDAPESIKHDSLSPTPAPTVTVTVTASPGSTSGGGTPSSTPTTSATSSATSTSRKTP